MKPPELEVGEVKIAELRARLRELLEMKMPRIVYRNSRPIAFLFSFEVPYIVDSTEGRSLKRRLHAELEAAIEKAIR